MSAVESGYNMVQILQNPQNRHPIILPGRRDVGCFLCLPSVTYGFLHNVMIDSTMKSPNYTICLSFVPPLNRGTMDISIILSSENKLKHLFTSLSNAFGNISSTLGFEHEIERAKVFKVLLKICNQSCLFCTILECSLKACILGINRQFL